MTKSIHTPEDHSTKSISVFGGLKNMANALFQNGYDHARDMAINSMILPGLGAAVLGGGLAAIGGAPNAVAAMTVLGTALGSWAGWKRDSRPSDDRVITPIEGNILHWGLPAALVTGAWAMANAKYGTGGTIPAEQIPALVGTMALATTPVFIQAAGVVKHAAEKLPELGHAIGEEFKRLPHFTL